MSANVTNMFSVKETPWHKLGTVLEESPKTAEEAIVAAGLDWKVKQKKAFLDDGRSIPAFVNVKEDTGDILGVTGPRYQPLQNKDAFSFFDPFVQKEEAFFETAGALDDNKKVWVLAKLNRDPLKVGPDAIDKYILLSNSHDGTTAIRVGFTPVRVVCQNTLSAAHSSGQSQLIRIKHTGRTKDALQNIRETMDTINAEFETTAEHYERLVQHSINHDDLKKYVKKTLDLKTDVEGNLSTRAENILNQVINLAERGTGNDVQGVRGTYWAAYNGVVEYLQYEKGNHEDKRLNSLWFGQSASVNKKALNTAFEMITEAA